MNRCLLGAEHLLRWFKRDDSGMIWAGLKGQLTVFISRVIEDCIICSAISMFRCYLCIKVFYNVSVNLESINRKGFVKIGFYVNRAK